MPPLVVVIAGSNEAGKSTYDSTLLPERIEFLKADEVAKGHSDYPSRTADLHRRGRHA